ncbi:MAG: hypothetical protein ACRD1H_08270, partial [Vicinamibacterales bacterium]
MSGGSRWGVWLIEVGALIATLVIGRRVLRRVADSGITTLVLSLLLYGLILTLEGGNLTEEYGLPLQFLSFLLLARLASARRSWALAALGLTLACLLLLRPNLIAVPLSVLAVHAGGLLRQRRRKDFARDLALVAGSGLMPVAAVTIVFAYAGGLREMVDAVVDYNLSYVQHSFADRIRSAVDGVETLAPAGIVLIGLAGWLVTAADRWARRQAPPVVLAAAIALPLEIGSTALSNREHAHYYISWLPALAILSAYGLGRMRRDERPEWSGVSARPASVRILLVVVIVCGIVPGWTLVEQLQAGVTGRLDPQVELAGWIRDETEPDDTVLVWGNRSGFNLLADRRSPSNYVYQLPLVLHGYRSDARTEAFLDDLRDEPPVLIIDATAWNTVIPPLDLERREDWRTGDPSYGPLPSMEAIYSWVEAN